MKNKVNETTVIENTVDLGSTDTHSKDTSTTDMVEEINYDLITSGPLYIDPRNKQPGYVYQFVSDIPGQIESYRRLGFTPVIDDFSVGTDVASKTSKFGSCVTVQSKCGQLLVLMRITQELFDRYEAHKDKKNRARTDALGYIEGVPEQYQTLNGQRLGEYKVTKSS